MGNSFYTPKLSDIQQAALTLAPVIETTPLQLNHTLSNLFDAQIYFKREDLQIVRSYKIRGAYNKISSLTNEKVINGVVCASAGNHAQGVAYACHQLKIHGTIFMPRSTPQQKIERVNLFGKEYIDLILEGDTFDDAKQLAFDFCTTNKSEFIHPFDDPKVIEGQATVGSEILNQSKSEIDFLFLPVGGGGLAAGVSTVFKNLSPQTKIIGVEPTGAPSMKTSIEKGTNVVLETIDNFVDGASVAQVGNHTYDICNKNLHHMVTVDEGKICQTILNLYNKDAIVVEPAGALTVSALEQFNHEIKGKTIVCVISGGNNDITRTAEIRERAVIYYGLKHYFLVRFPQRAGALKEFVADILGPQDDITHFEYTKKHAREKGFAVVGIELRNVDDFDPLLSRMKKSNFYGEYLNNKKGILDILI